MPSSGDSRAAKRAAASGTGAARSPVQSTRAAAAAKPSVTDPNSGQSVAAYAVHRARGPLVVNDPVPLYRPMLAPGVRDKIGYSMARCKLLPTDRTTAAGDPNPFAFVFHYNPSQVVVSSSSDPTIKLTTEVDTTTRNILAVGGAIVLSGMLDRQQEVWANSRSKHPGPGNTRRFRDFGTLYDIEWLFRVFNGDPKSRANRQIHGLVANQSNYGYLFPTTVEVFLNSTSRFLAFPTSIDISHQKYTPTMVPTVTTFDISMVIAARGRGSRADLVSNSGAQVPGWATQLGVQPSAAGSAGPIKPGL